MMSKQAGNYFCLHRQSFVESGKKRAKAQTSMSWKQKVYSCLKLHNYHKEDFSVQGVVWLESNTKHL